MFSYQNPVKINFDVDFKNALREISLKPYARFLLLTSRGFQARGLCALAREIFGDKIRAIAEISANPNLSDLSELKSRLQNEFKIHGIQNAREIHKNIQNALQESCAIIALGGGSVLDSAKFIALCAEIFAHNGALEVQNIKGALDIFAIPTTAGTGSELTKWATIWDKNAKYSLAHDLLYAKEAFYDCSLLLSMRRDLSVYTALDALSHAIESIWNKNANPITITHATRAIEIISTNLPALAQNLASLKLRKKIALGSIHAGLAFSNTQTALAHAISYPLTLRHNIPHGLACSFALPLFLRYIKENSAQFSEIYKILAPHMDAIHELFSVLGISSDLKKYGLDAEFIDEIFSSLNQRAQNSALDAMQIKKYLLDNL